MITWGSLFSGYNPYADYLATNTSIIGSLFNSNFLQSFFLDAFRFFMSLFALVMQVTIGSIIILLFIVFCYSFLYPVLQRAIKW